ncbi:MAG: type I 3-dehydroquinate dehydratase [Gemmataceae bacterium]
MGDIGQCSRFLALKYGAPWIYTAFNKERGVAPGIPCLDDLRTTFPVRSINSETAIFGVVGDPVGHSLSPLLHNHIYKRLGINALYLPFRVPRGMLEQAFKEYSHIPVCGYSVTVPQGSRG